MITYSNIVNRFREFAEANEFVGSFSHGMPDDVDLDKHGQYPLLHVVYTGGSYGQQIKTYSLEVYVLDKVAQDLDDKSEYSADTVTNAESICEDILADMENGGQVFSFDYDYVLSAAQIRPLYDTRSNVLTGSVLAVTFDVAYLYDGCNAPLVGVSPGGGQESGDQPVDVSVLFDLDDVGQGSTPVADADVLFYQATVNKWVNKPSSLLTVGTAAEALSVEWTNVMNAPTIPTSVTDLSDVTSAGSGLIMSTAERVKLTGIEISADRTDTTNVRNAGALMDDEVANLADVKSFDPADYATAAQGTLADSAQQPPAEGAFVDGDKTKLDGIESGAEVNPTAAEIKTSYESNANTNAYTDAEQTKLGGIATGAEVNVNADWNATSGDAEILNKPTIPTVPATIVESVSASSPLASSGGTTPDISLSASGVSAGSYTSADITVDQYGRVTAASSGSGGGGGGGGGGGSLPTLTDEKIFIGDSGTVQSDFKIENALPTADNTQLVWNQSNGRYQHGFAGSKNQVSVFEMVSTAGASHTITGSNNVDWGDWLAGTVSLGPNNKFCAGWNGGTNFAANIIQMAPLAATSTFQISYEIELVVPAGNFLGVGSGPSVGWCSNPGLTQQVITTAGTHTIAHTGSVQTVSLWALANTTSLFIQVLVGSGPITVNPKFWKVEITHA